MSVLDHARPVLAGGGPPEVGRPSADDGRVRVYFTTDVECSVGGAFADSAHRPWGYDLRFHGRFANQSRDWGVGFIMDSLERYGFSGTFFVEAFCERYFGREGLSSACAAMLERGHDVQLHLHPVMLDLEPGAVRQVHRHSDDFWAYGVDEQEAMLADGIAILRDCGVKDLVAFRAGNFSANASTWRAMNRVGLTVGSNMNLAYLGEGPRGGTCRLPEEPRRNDLFAVEGQAGLLELPITSVWAMGPRGRGEMRHLAIPALSSAELIQSLQLARASGIVQVTLILHSFDFAHLDDPIAGTGRPIMTHVRRLERLCQWLDGQRDAFVVRTVGELAGRQVGDRSADDPVPRTSKWRGYARQLEQLSTRWAFG